MSCTACGNKSRRPVRSTGSTGGGYGSNRTSKNVSGPSRNTASKSFTDSAREKIRGLSWSTR